MAPFDNANFKIACIHELLIRSLRNVIEVSVTVPCCKIRQKKINFMVNKREIVKVSKRSRRYLFADIFGK